MAKRRNPTPRSTGSQEVQQVQTSSEVPLTEDDEIQILGTFLQVTASVASISVAFYISIYSLEHSLIQNGTSLIKVPQVFYSGLAVSANLNLLAAVSAISRLHQIMGLPATGFIRPNRFGLTYFFTYWGVVVLWVIFILVAVPPSLELVNLVLEWLKGIFDGNFW